MDSERYFVWGLNGYLKVLVYDRKYNTEANGGKGGYDDVLRIEEPKSKAPQQ